MAARSFSRPVRVALGSLVAMMILSLVAVPAFGGAVDAKGRHRHGQRQQQVASHDRDNQVQSAARKPGKGKKRKKSKAQGTLSGGAQALADPGAGNAPGAGITPNAGIQGFDGGLVTSLPATTKIWTVAMDCTQDSRNGTAVNPQRCNSHPALTTTDPGGMNARIEVIASPENCSTVRFEIAWKDTANTSHSWRSEPVSPGGSTGVVDLGDGVRWIDIYAIGVLGGCNYGTLTNWAATIELTTSSDLSLIVAEE